MQQATRLALLAAAGVGLSAIPLWMVASFKACAWLTEDQATLLRSGCRVEAPPLPSLSFNAPTALTAPLSGPRKFHTSVLVPISSPFTPGSSQRMGAWLSLSIS